MNINKKSDNDQNLMLGVYLDNQNQFFDSKKYLTSYCFWFKYLKGWFVIFLELKFG